MSTVTHPRRYDHLIDGASVASDADRIARHDPVALVTWRSCSVAGMPQQ